MKNAMILTAVISALFAGSACAKTPVKTPEKVVSQTTKITQKDFDRLEKDIDTADFLKNSKWTPIIKSKIGADNHKFLLDEIKSDKIIVLIEGHFTKTTDRLNNNIHWYSSYAWYKYSRNNLVCVALNTNNDLYIAFLDKNNNIHIERKQKDIDLSERRTQLPGEFDECVSDLILSKSKSN